MHRAAGRRSRAGWRGAAARAPSMKLRARRFVGASGSRARPAHRAARRHCAISGQASSRTLRDRLRIEPADVGRGLQVHQRLRADGLGAPLLGRAVVEEGIRPRVEDRMRQRRRRRQLAGGDAHLAGFDARQQRARSRRRPSSRAGSRAASASTSGWSGISRSPTMFSAQASWSGNTTVSRSCASVRWNCGGTLRAAVHAPHRQRRGGVPAPARAEHRRVEQRLHQHVARAWPTSGSAAPRRARSCASARATARCCPPARWPAARS